MAEAVVYFQQAETACQANHPLRAQLLNELGAALIVEHKEKQAIPYLQEAVQLDPNLTAAHHNLSLCRS
jgi:tetratricopeptide (TPR) repeat protein